MALKDVYFEPNTLTIPANTDVALNLKNEGFLAHDFTLEGTAIKSGVMMNGDAETLTLNLAPGTYTFFCSQIGHRAQGMEGTLTVQ